MRLVHAELNDRVTSGIAPAAPRNTTLGMRD
jgi:hypothetical protein